MRVCARSRIGIHALLAFGLTTITIAHKASAQDAPETCEHLTPGADEHTCLHGYLGPFGSVGAAPYPGAAPTTNVSETHVLYTVVLSGDPGDNQSAVLFEPTNSGAYSFYMNAEYPLELLDSEGEPVPVRLENDVPACPEYLGWFRVYEGLEAGQTYTLVVGPVEEPFVQVVSEVLAVFRAFLYVDSDDDGFGVMGESVRSWCGVASGYSERAGDCDDTNPDAFPEAQEMCNGIDDNCDGEVDESEHALCPADAACMGEQGCFTSPDHDCIDSSCDGSTSGAVDEPVENDEDPGSGRGSGGRSTTSPVEGGSGTIWGGNGGESSGQSTSSPEDDDSSHAKRRADPGCACDLNDPGKQRMSLGFGWLLVALASLLRRRRAGYTERERGQCARCHFV